MTIRALIADDEALVRGGFTLILEAQSDIQVVGEAADGREALEGAVNLDPDIVLMDVRMPGLDGLEATRRLLQGRKTKTKVLILTTFDMDEYVYEALRAGASGFLLKSVPPAELVRAVRAVVAGELLLSPSVTRRLIEQYVRTPPPGNQLPSRLQTLTPRELEVLRLVAQGLSNPQIGDTLFIGEATVKSHINRILSKLGLRDRVQAVILAYETGFVAPGAQAPQGGELGE